MLRGPESVAFDGTGPGPYRPRPQVERVRARLVDVREQPGLRRRGLHRVQGSAGGAHREQVRPPAGPAVPPPVQQPLHRGRVEGADARRPGRRRGDGAGRGGRRRAAPLHQRGRVYNFSKISPKFSKYRLFR